MRVFVGGIECEVMVGCCGVLARAGGWVEIDFRLCGVCVWVDAYTHTNIQTCRHTCTHAHTLTHTCTHTHSRTNAHVKGPMHLGTPPLTFSLPLPLFVSPSPSQHFLSLFFHLSLTRTRSLLLFASHPHLLVVSRSLLLFMSSCLSEGRKYKLIHQILTPNPTFSSLPYLCRSVPLSQGLKEHSDAPPYGDQLPCKCTQTHTPSLSLAHTHIHTITIKKIHIHAFIHTNTYTRTHTHTNMNTQCKAPL